MSPLPPYNTSMNLDSALTLLSRDRGAPPVPNVDVGRRRVGAVRAPARAAELVAVGAMAFAVGGAQALVGDPACGRLGELGRGGTGSLGRGRGREKAGGDHSRSSQQSQQTTHRTSTREFACIRVGWWACLLKSRFEKLEPVRGYGWDGNEVRYD